MIHFILLFKRLDFIGAKVHVPLIFPPPPSFLVRNIQNNKIGRKWDWSLSWGGREAKLEKVINPNCIKHYLSGDNKTKKNCCEISIRDS